MLNTFKIAYSRIQIYSSTQKKGRAIYLLAFIIATAIAMQGFIWTLVFFLGSVIINLWADDLRISYLHQSSEDSDIEGLTIMFILYLIILIAVSLSLGRELPSDSVSFSGKIWSFTIFISFSMTLWALLYSTVNLGNKWSRLS